MKKYTVGEVAKLARISVRTLHHYDEIHLVEPSARSSAGYRLYTETDLERLQQVLFFRELELELRDIAAILDDPGFDRKKALIAQRALLERRLDRIGATLSLVNRTIEAIEGERTMTEEQMFESEVEERWGKSESYRISRERTKRYGEEDWARIKAEQRSLLDAFAALAEAGIAPDSMEAKAVAERSRLFIDTHFYPCSRAMHAGLGEMYVDDPRFAATYEARSQGLAEYVRAAIRANSI